jgi:hypothetical protein
VVAVVLELGALVRLGRVLHRQRVQAELGADQVQLVLVGLEQAHPDEPLTASRQGQRVDVRAGVVAVAGVVVAPVHQGAVELAAADQVHRRGSAATLRDGAAGPACRTHLPTSVRHQREATNSAVTRRGQ